MCLRHLPNRARRSDNGLEASGWGTVTSVLAALPRLNHLNHVNLADSRVDLSGKEEGMALAATANLLAPNFFSSLQDLDLR